MHTKNILKNDLNKIKAMLAKTAYDAKNEAADAVFDSYLDVKEKTNNMKFKVQDYAKKKPFTTIGLSILAGIFLNRIFHK